MNGRKMLFEILFKKKEKNEKESSIMMMYQEVHVFRASKRNRR